MGRPTKQQAGCEEHPNEDAGRLRDQTRQHREGARRLLLATDGSEDVATAARAAADERFRFPIPDGYPDLQAAPLLCAGLIGSRSLRFADDAERLGLYVSESPAVATQ